MVMTKLRKRMKLFLWFAAIVFVAFIFLQWGMNITRTRRLTMLERGIVATVNGQHVSYSAYSNVLSRYRQEDASGAIASVAFDELVNNVLVDNVLRRRNLLLKDEDIVEIIRNNPPPELQNDTMLQTDGEFDYSKYLQVISNPANIQWLTNYENLIRTVVPRQQLYTEVTSATRLTSLELFRAYIRDNTKVKVSYKVVDPNTFDVMLPVADSIERFYEMNKHEFDVTLGRQVQYVLSEVKSSLDTSEAIESAYEIAQSFITFAKEEGFEGAAKGMNFNIDTINTAQIGEIDLTPLLNTHAGETMLGPIYGEKGFYVVKLGTKISSYEPPIEGKRDLYLREKKKQKAEERAKEIATNFRGGSITRFFTLRDTLEGIPYGSHFYLDALALSPGDIELSEPTEVDEDFYVIKCLEKEEPETENIQDKLREFQGSLLTNLQNEVDGAWFSNLKSSATVKDYRYEIR